MENELKSILEESIYTITKNSELFKSEPFFNMVLAYELKKRLKNNGYDTLIEYCALNCFSEKKEDVSNYNYYIDIVIKNDNEFYPIELKYSAFKDGSIYGGTRYGLATSRFVKDIKILENLRGRIPVFTKGFCILLTNSKYILNPSDYIKNSDHSVYKDFVISPETKTIGGKTLYHNEEEVKIEKYDLEWSDKITESKNFDGFRFLIVEVPGKK